MFTIVLFARVINREATLLNSLGAGALLLLVWRPSDVMDPSFQLTFGSMAAIVGLAFPIISKCRAVGEWTPRPGQPFPPNLGRRMRRVCEWLYWNPRRWEIEQGRQVWSAGLFKAADEGAWRAPARRAITRVTASPTQLRVRTYGLDGLGSAASVIDDFVAEHPGGWNLDQWLGLLGTLRERGFETSDQDAIGLALEGRRRT